MEESLTSLLVKKEKDLQRLENLRNSRVRDELKSKDPTISDLKEMVSQLHEDFNTRFARIQQEIVEKQDREANMVATSTQELRDGIKLEEDLRACTEKIQELEEVILIEKMYSNDLKKNIELSHAQIDSLIAEKKELHEEKTRLLNSEGTYQQIEQLKQLNNDMNKRLSILENQKNPFIPIDETTHKETKVITETYQDCLNQNERLFTKIQELEEENRALLKKNKNLNEENQDLLTKHKEIQEENQDLSAELSAKVNELQNCYEQIEYWKSFAENEQLKMKTHLLTGDKFIQPSERPFSQPYDLDLKSDMYEQEIARLSTIVTELSDQLEKKNKFDKNDRLKNPKKLSEKTIDRRLLEDQVVSLRSTLSTNDLKLHKSKSNQSQMQDLIINIQNSKELSKRNAGSSKFSRIRDVKSRLTDNFYKTTLSNY